MTLLAAIAPMLADGSEFQLIVSKTSSGLRVVTVPKLRDFTPDTSDAGLAALQGALAQPMIFTVGTDAPDEELSVLLAQAHQVRAQTLDQFTAYQEQQRQAQQAARVAAETKTTTPKKEPTARKSPAPSAASPTTLEATSESKQPEQGVAVADLNNESPSPAASEQVPAPSLGLFGAD